jgi:hypothetical protein
MRQHLASFPCILCCIPLAAQGSWSLLSGGATPAGASPAPVFDSARAVSVLAV